MEAQTQEGIEEMLNKAYKNVVEKEEQINRAEERKKICLTKKKKQISKAWEREQGADIETNIHKALGGEEKTKFNLGMFLSFITMFLMFFAFNYFDQKNNVETIQILASENTRLKQQIENIQNPPLSAEEIKEIKKSLFEIDDDVPILNPKKEAKK